MANDPPYGGRIIAREDGSVLYQISAREFREDRNIDGTLEYAIRRAVSSRTILPSLDSKCLVQVQSGSPSTTKFLIVSGYAAPELEDDTLLVGKSYYITADAPRPGMTNQNQILQPLEVPLYDLSLRYDDYDIERVRLNGKALPFDVEPSQLDLCYQHWSIAYFDPGKEEWVDNPQNVLGFDDAKAALIKEREMQRQASALQFVRAAELLNEIKGLHDQNVVLPQVAWVSRWRRVRDRSDLGSGISPSTGPSPTVDPEEEPITASGIIRVPGSRTITAEGLDSPGTFVLMCHGDCWKPNPHVHT